jgi:hypothetical protein
MRSLLFVPGNSARMRLAGLPSGGEDPSASIAPNRDDSGHYTAPFSGARGSLPDAPNLVRARRTMAALQGTPPASQPIPG